jgi:DNA-binding LacI/PurR family transcriptional regulator
MEHLSRNWEERRAPTLKDVARAVGISEATASVVLNGARSGTRVSAKRRQDVIDAAARIGYRPNSLARALQAGHNHRIGFYSGRQAIDARSLFFTELLGGVCAGATAQDSNVVLFTAADDEVRLLELLTGASLDGLVLQCRPEDEIFPLLQNLRVPAVVINDAETLDLPVVGVDEVQGGCLQAERLAERGHRHALYKQSRSLTLSVQKRMTAFVARARELGIRTTIRYQDDFDEPIDAADIALVSEGSDRATAVVGWHDHAADRICARLTDAGIEVPGQVAVLGFDGFGSYYTPRFRLSSVRAPWFEVGRTAADLIAALMRGDQVPHLTSLPVEFVPGSTD